MPTNLGEVREILDDTGIEVLSLDEISCNDDIPETADTLEGNALIKAKWVKQHYGYDCFADDTGLEVEALGGARVCIRRVMQVPVMIRLPM